MAKNKISLTDAQEEAINLKDKTLLVSAAAGSGKTFTLTERIIKRITKDHADISKMLIVTFTKASAADLKTKIFKAVSNALAKDPKNKALANELTKLNSAKICTIDSFYFDLVKSNFTEANVSPTVKIIDSGEYKLIAKNIMDEVIDHFYECEDNFPALVECFTTVRSVKDLNELFLGLYSNVSTTPEGIDFIKYTAEKYLEEADKDLMSTTWGELLREESLEFFTHCRDLFVELINRLPYDEITISYIPSFEVNLEFYNAMVEKLSDPAATYLEIKELIYSYKAKTLPRVAEEDVTTASLYMKEIRTNVTADVREHRDKLFSLAPDTISRELKETAKYTDIIYRLLKEFDIRITEHKNKLDVMTFTDIRRKTYDLLIKDGKITELAKNLSQQYTDIYIDEYQDVDPIQDEIFKAISTPTNRFMVGDIKQSIYKFRGAEPTLFSKYRTDFSGKDPNAKTIFMSDNFRCDQSVIKFTNDICSELFKMAGGCVEYCDEDNLKFSKDKVTSEYLDCKVTVHALSIPNKNSKAYSEYEISSDIDLEKIEWECDHIADIIASLVGKEKKANGELIEAGDIAVLFRKKSFSPYVSKALHNRGIKVAEAEALQYFENDDVLLMLCILNAVDNPERDNYLAGALRSPIFNFTANDLLYIRNKYEDPNSLYSGLCQFVEDYVDENGDKNLYEKAKHFLNTLSIWQDNAESLPIDKFLLMLFNSEDLVASGIISNQTNDGEGGNVLLLYDYARAFQGNGFKGVYEFIEYVNSLITENESFPATSKRGAKDRVSLMTIHKSKGLEFPVCLVVGSGLKFSKNESRNSLVYSYPYGITMNLSDESGFAQTKTIMRELLLRKIFEQNAEEEIRVLYVALTRARERLYVIGTTSADKEKIINDFKEKNICADRYTVLKSLNSFLDWILLCLTKSVPDYVDFSILTPNELRIYPDLQKDTDFNNVTEDEELLKKLSDSFEFKYKYVELSTIPSKVSVSDLSPNMLDPKDTDKRSSGIFTKENSVEIPDFFTRENKAGSTAAERGTATHLFLQFCHFEYAATHGVDEELERLYEKKYLPQNAKELIYKDELDNFFESELITKILTAKKVIREQRFIIYCSPENFTHNSELIERSKYEKIAIQGAIDLILIDHDDKVHLYDYKTDRLSTAELNDPTLAKEKLSRAHKNQLAYYAKAVEMMFNKQCESVEIYSTHSAKLYQIDISDIYLNIK